MKNMFFNTHRKTKILIIDDEEDVCVYLKSILERTGKFEASATTSPIEGIELAKSTHPDVILLDIIMSEMDGTEVAAQLYEDHDTRDILVIFVSVLVKPQDLKENEGKIGGHPFISKPLDKDDLIARLETLLQEAHAK
ncbi:MAG: response regulator [Candidatus Omnitrophica bacterium]|nr:response regulator [Candidatus Omnitrophota bacterium]